LAVTVIGPFTCHSLTSTQLSLVSSAVSACNFPYAKLKGTIHLYVGNPGTVNTGQGVKQAWGSTDRVNREVMVWKGLTGPRFKYACIHEMAHIADNDLCGGSEHQAFLTTYLKPFMPQFDHWREGTYYYRGSECFAHQFAVRLYLGTGDWGSVLSGGKTNLNGYYRRYFQTTDVSTVKTMIENGPGGDGGDDPDPPDPGFVEFRVSKDLARRKKVGTTTVQGAGKEQHLVFGRLSDGKDNWLYTSLIECQLDWPTDIESIDTASLEVTLTADALDPHLSISGDKAVLMGARILQGWTEGTRGEGAWNADNWQNPTWDTNLRTIGTVGQHPKGTRLSFDVLPFIKEWAPASLNVGGAPGQGKANHGMFLRASTQDDIAGAFDIASQEHPTADYRPVILITYTPTSLPPNAEVVQPASAMAGATFDFIGNYVDPQGRDELGFFEMQVRKAGGGANVWLPPKEAANANSVATGQWIKSSSEAPQGTWVAGQSYEWRHRVWSAGSGKVSEWTAWIGFSVTGTTPTLTALSLGSKATLDNVYFGGPYSDPDGTTVVDTPAPLGFPRMSMWVTAWAGWDVAQATSKAEELRYMHLRGVILEGIQWDNSYGIPGMPGNPALCAQILQVFLDAGITPWLALFVGQFDTTETNKSIAAWNAGSGKWGGIVLDAEDGWVNYHNNTPTAANNALTAYINAMRTAGVTKVAYAPYYRPSYWDTPPNDYNYPLWNSLCDLVLPQMYFSGDGIRQSLENVDKIFNRCFNDFADNNLNKPIVPLNNAYGANADPEVRDKFFRKALDEKGAISVWRYPIENTAVRDVLHAIPRDAQTITGQYKIINVRLQLRSEPQGDPAWNNTTGFLWDTGEQPITAEEKTAQTIKRLYTGQALAAGSYTYRVQVQNEASVWSAWAYGTLTLTVGYQPAPGAYNFLSGYGRVKMDRRIVIKEVRSTYAGYGTNDRGPGKVKAILYDASNIGASIVANDIGEFYFTLPTTHPQASEIEPLQRHYSMEFYRAGAWRPVFEGLITDMDATEDEVVFYGLDYMGLLSKSIETSFYNWDQPEEPIDEGGAKYVDKAISFIIKDQLSRGKALTDSPMGFIGVEAQGSSTLMENIAEHVSIHAEFRERLSFILGLIQSAKQGTGKRSRLWVERQADGTYQWRYANNAGVDTRDNLRMEYGELVQGFRLVLLGNWAAKVYGVGRITNEIKLRFKSATAPGITTGIWGNVQTAAIWQDLIDENDLQRRVKQLAMETGKFGKNVALGLRVNGLEPLDGYDLMDSIPVTIQRGAVDTTRYGSGYWTILGVEWKLYPDGHEDLTLAIKPREDSTPPDPDLIPSKPVSSGPEWFRLGLVGQHLTYETLTSLRADGTVTAQVTVTTDPLAVEGYGYSVIQIAQNNSPGVADFTNATTFTYQDPSVTLYDLLPGVDYSIRVGAYDSAGNFSGWSAPTTFSTDLDLEAPAVPGGLTVTPAIGGLNVTWLPVGAPDLDHYDLAYKTGAGAEVVTSPHTTIVALTGLLSNTTYQLRVRAVDTSGNASAYTAYVSGTTALVETGDVGDLDASVIKTGTLVIGGTDSPTLEVYNAAGQLIFRVDNNGILAIDPDNTDRQMLFADGTLTFTSDNWVTSGVAIDGDGITATAIRLGVAPGGHNMIPNSSFENVPFLASASKVWTSSTDWGTTIGTDVGVDKTTASLKLTAVSY